MNRLNRIFVACLAFMLLAFASCKDPEPNPIAESQYPEAVAQIVVNSCATSGCHIAPAPPAALALHTWTALFEGSSFGAVLIPGSPEWSHFLQHTNTYDDLGIRATPVMPPDSTGAPLSRAQVETLKTWIEDGAPDKNGNTRWAEQEQASNNKLFTLCAGSDLIAVTDLQTNLVMHMIPVGVIEAQLEAPHYIRLSPDKQFMYVTLIGGEAVEKYRTDTYEKVGRIVVGPDPALIQLNASGTRAIITHWNDTGGSPKLTMLNTEDMSIVDQVIASGDLLSYPHGMAANSDFSLLYVVANSGNYYAKWQINESGFVDHEEIPVDPANSPVPQPSSTYKPYHCLLSPDGSRFFVSCSGTDEVRVFDTATDDLLTSIVVGDFPRLMDYDPVSKRLFVACANQESFPDQGSIRGCVSVINAEALSFERFIYRLGHRPHGVGVDVSNRRLYVSSENTGGIDPPHHPLDGTGPPGKYNVVDLNTLEIITDMETEVAVYPNALIISE